MTEHIGGIPARGAIDLSRLTQAATAPSSAPSSGGGVEVVDVTEASFQSFAEQSLRRPVFLLLGSRLAPQCAELRTRFEKVAAPYAGRLVLGVADVDSDPGIAQAFQLQAVPAMVAIIGGRPAPLFQGAPDDEQLRSIIDQVLDIAAQTGIGSGADAAGEQEAQPEPLPPLHQEAYDAIERGDYEAAIAAYEKALKENPKDADARAGKAQVALLARSGAADLAAIRAEAAAKPDDIDAQLAVADIDVLGGQVEDAFARLLDVIRGAQPEDKERVRVRLVELFEVVGPTDPRVIRARQALASALY